MLLLATNAETNWNGIKVVSEPCPVPDQKDRIIEALWPLGDDFPNVNEATLSRYYKYLTVSLSFPFTACYPKPTNSFEEVQHRRTVVELLDPAHYICDEFEGILCKTRMGKYEVNLPLIELEVPDDSPNFQFIEDYWYWFWNWR